METANKGFEFIDGTQSDRLTRKKARSHAMKGKNLGRTLNRRPRFAPSKATSAESLALSHSGVEDERTNTTQTEQGNATSSIPYALLNEIAVPGTLPVEVRAHARYAIREFMSVTFNAFYPPHLCNSQDALRAHWLGILFADFTSFHCTIALMMSLRSFMFGSTSIPPDALYHLSQAITLVNTSLGTSSALSDSNLSVVVFLVLQGLVREEYNHAKVHMDGLKNMIALRGGLDRAGLNEVLLVKICKTDIDFALHYGTRASFHRDRMPFIAASLPPSPTTFLHTLVYPGIAPPLKHILEDATHISTLFNRPDPPFRIDLFLLQEFTVSLGTRLLAFHALLDPPLSNPLDATVHIGLVAFLTTLFLQVGKRRYLKYKLVAKRVREIGEMALGGGGQVNKEVVLWLLCIGSVSVLDEGDRKWAVSRVRELVVKMEVEGWDGLRGFLGRWPWVGQLHDETGRELWREVVQT